MTIARTRRRRRRATLIALLAVIPATGFAAEATPTDWVRLLAGCDPARRLTVSLDDGDVIAGYPADARGDSLRLALAPGGPPAVAASYAGILGVRQERGAAAHGWTVGSAVGAGGGALAGAFFGLLVRDLGEGDPRDSTTPVLVSTIMLATVASVGAGGIGALIGSGGSHEYELDPLDPRRRGLPDRPRVRLEPRLGLAVADDMLGDWYDGGHAGLYMPLRVGGGFDLGPELAWFGLALDEEHWDGRATDVPDTWMGGLNCRWSPAARGLQPFASLGVAWYHRGTSYGGVSLGLGLRWRTRRGQDFVLEVRSHQGSGLADDEPGRGMTTASAGFSFGL